MIVTIYFSVDIGLLWDYVTTPYGYFPPIGEITDHEGGTAGDAYIGRPHSARETDIR